MIRPIVTDIEYLRQKSGLVITTTYAIERLVMDLRDTMTAHNGVGLSAIQIGVPLRVAVILTPMGIASIINPRVVQVSEKMETDYEGCLSLPDTMVAVPRFYAIEIRALTEYKKPSKPHLVGLKGSVARIVQHEMDHMDGKLIIDYLKSAGESPIQPQQET
jgi:peptide deformylase